MTLRDRVSSVTRTVPRSSRRPPRWVAVLSVPVVVAVVGLGVWVTGAVLTPDATLAMVLTGAWFALAGLLAVIAGLRWRALALPVIVTYVVSSAAIGGYLLFTSKVDRVVKENVLVADPTQSPTPAGASSAGVAPSAAAAGPATVAAGTFQSRAHETRGKATLLQTADGGRVLTLTGFRTAPGPDLRVYLVPGDGSNVTGAVDLGRLKGNKGNQQYAVPPGAKPGAVVVWCRAFSVAFGAASLA